MGRKNFNAYLKKQKAEQKRKRKEDKRQEKEARRSEPTSGKLEDMIAYIDADGNITTEPPEDNPPARKTENKTDSNPE